MRFRMPKYHQNFYRPQNPDKYVGDVNKIYYRSSWEAKFMIWADSNPSIIKWGSEELVIPYYNELDGKQHRYFPDFIILYKHHATNEQRRAVIEIKPDAQTRMPVLPKRQTRRYLTEVKTYLVNEAKWKAATAWCKKNGFEFHIFTEKHLKV